jgi:FMN phosphatase YigB (HAD superfamily)
MLPVHKKLLITDLDNTLYDWVTFFTSSFRAMVEELTQLLDVDEGQILSEFRAVHQKHGNSEQPFAVLELPSLHKRFPGTSRTEILKAIDPALHRFNSVRKRTLVLYPGVIETLKALNDVGVKVVDHTEAILVNAYWRLRSLQLDEFFSRLYTLQGMNSIHVSDTARWTDPPPHFLSVLPREERKPNPRLLLDICQQEGVEPQNAVYLGDSLVRDIAMATNAGVTAVWARYGTQYDQGHWAYLVRVTHWTDEDVQREKDLKARFGNVHPDFTIDSISELLTIALD